MPIVNFLLARISIINFQQISTKFENIKYYIMIYSSTEVQRTIQCKIKETKTIKSLKLKEWCEKKTII